MDLETDLETDLDTLFTEPEGYYPEIQPTFATHCMLSGQTVRVRLVGSHPLYGNLLWNAGRQSAHYIEEHPEYIRDKAVLEIGAAAGVPSIVSAICGARVAVMTDYPDPDLVENMRFNADLAQRERLFVEGYKWGSPVETLLSYVSDSGSNGSNDSNGTGDDKFDTLIMADVVYSHREHPNLIKTMHATLKRAPESVALVIFTPYEPWLLPKTEQFFPLAEENGFTVTKVFETMMDEVLFEDDPGDERLRKTVFGYELRWTDSLQ